LAATKYAFNTGVTVLDISLFRLTFIFIQAPISVWKNKLSMNVPKEQRGILFMRNLLSFGSQFGMAASVFFLPLMITQILFNTAPFWLALLSYLFLGESLSNF